MKHELPQPDTCASSDEATVMPVNQLARRKMLLKTAGVGVAALAAAAPMKVLAGGGSCGGDDVCSISGMQSAHTSHRPGELVKRCGGWSPGWWKQKKIGSDPAVPRNPWPASALGSPTHLLKTNAVLTNSPLTVTLFKLMRHQDYQNSDEKHWICAWLNALAYVQGINPTGYEFPYTADQVIKFYREEGDYSASEALNFFKLYMEKHG